MTGGSDALLAVLIGCLQLVAGGPGRSSEPPSTQAPAARCAALLALFDELVISRFDAPLLALEHDELAEARSARDRAEADCAAGDHAFGVPLIESALRQIGVFPPANGEQSGD